MGEDFWLDRSHTYYSVGCHRTPSVCWDPWWNTKGGAPHRGYDSNSSSISCLEIWIGKRDFNGTEHLRSQMIILSNEQILSACCVLATGKHPRRWLDKKLSSKRWQSHKKDWFSILRTIFLTVYICKNHRTGLVTLSFCSIWKVDASKLQVFSCK